MKEKLIGAVALTLMTTPGFALAEITDSLSGTISIGAIVTDSSNNLNPDGSKKRLDNLDSSAYRETTLLPGIIGRVTWDVGEPDGMKFYLTTDPPVNVKGWSVTGLLAMSKGDSNIDFYDTVSITFGGVLNYHF